MAKSAPRAAGQPRNDVYTGLLAISLVAMIIGCFLLYLDFAQYGKKKPDAVPSAGTVKAPSAPTQPAR
jgi:hypothetical protein